MHADELATWVDYLHREVPLTRAMHLQAGEVSESGLSLSVPLAGNTNDKGTAFGGMLATLCIACGWAMVVRVCRAAGLAVDIVIVENRIRYLCPADEDPITAFAELPPPSDADAFINEVKQGALAKISVEVEAQSGGRKVATFRGNYAAKLFAESAKTK